MGEEVSDMHRLGDMDGVGNFDGSRYDWGVGDMACFWNGKVNTKGGVGLKMGGLL